MSKQSKRHTPLSKSQPAKTGRPVWLVPTLLALVGIAVAGGLVWLVQRNNTAPAQTLPGAAGSTSVTTANGPSIAVDQELFDYGNVKLNSTIETVIQVKNTGDQALALDQNPVVELVDGCWPPNAVVGSTTLRPGEETTVKLQFMMHAGMDGQHSFRVHIRSNDPVTPDKQVMILSNWVP